MPIILEQYSPKFIEAWDLYKETYENIKTISENMGLTKFDIFMPSHTGSQDIANSRWNYLLKEIVIEGNGISEDIMLISVAIYCQDMKSALVKNRKATFHMFHNLLDINRETNKTVYIIDYIREAYRIATNPKNGEKV